MLIEEKIDGAEFTIQAISDGRPVIFPPSTYDFPYRFDGDEGPGTGGMGSLTMASPVLPFMTPGHYEQACSIIQRVSSASPTKGRHFTGVMNSGFFATADGVKVIEFNARFGRPRVHEHHEPVRGRWPAVMERLASGSLADGDARLRDEASVVLLVSPDYALRPGPAARLQPWSAGASRSLGTSVFFSSAVEIDSDRYRTVGTSRAVALEHAATLEQAPSASSTCAASVPELEWRRDVGDESYLHGLGPPARFTCPAASAKDCV